jgi:RNA polymerase sigma-54 factor
MDVTQKQNLTQTMRQEQIMTQRQIQALELLFLPVLELQATIDGELEKNPVLELDPPDDIREEPFEDDDQWLDKILKVDEENRYIRVRHSTYSRDDEEKRRHYLDSITAEPTFQESLLEQLRFLELEPGEYECCETVISGLDDDGMLTSHPADLAMATGQSIEKIRAAISIVQRLEPPGIAAGNLRERLLIQLERRGRRDTLAWHLVEQSLEDLAANRLPQIAKKFGVSLDQLKEAIEEIQNLQPRISTEPVSPHEYIHEEVVVACEEDRAVAKMKNDYLPNLFISKQYRELLNDPTTSREARDYIKDKLRAGVFLINSIIQRQTTIKRIVDDIVEIQKDFFLSGSENMKPMTMLQVAERLGIHETTVSRAVAGKYMRCRHGLLPLKYFFSAGYEGEDGSSVSNNVIKNAIRKLIETEDEHSPLSDSRIASLLKKQGYGVARRTVAKYREALGIPSSNLRRQYG